MISLLSSRLRRGLALLLLALLAAPAGLLPRPALASPAATTPTTVLYWLLGTSVRKIAIFAFFSSLLAWCMKLEGGKSKDVLLALPEKQPQAYEKNRHLLGQYTEERHAKMG